MLPHSAALLYASANSLKRRADDAASSAAAAAATAAAAVAEGRGARATASLAAAAAMASERVSSLDKEAEKGFRAVLAVEPRYYEARANLGQV